MDVAQRSLLNFILLGTLLFGWAIKQSTNIIQLKLEKFPLKELKDLLSPLGLAKNGSKRVLVAKIAKFAYI